MPDTFPFLTNCISASMIHTTNLCVETKRTGKIYLIQKVSACYYVKFSFNNKHKSPSVFRLFSVDSHGRNSHFSNGYIFEMVKI